jgi:hypothetical protein
MSKNKPRDRDPLKEYIDAKVDAFRKWEKTHNRENYGRYDAFNAGTAWQAAKDSIELDEMETKCIKACELIDEIDTAFAMDCGDNSCMFAKEKGGMRTNGGCRCFGGLNVVKKNEVRKTLAKIKAWREGNV